MTKQIPSTGNLFLTILLLLTACSAPNGVYHTVRSGQTLYSISRAYGINQQHLARVNDIDDPTRLRTGQKLFIPGATRALDVSVHRPAKSEPAPVDPAPVKSSPPPARAAALPPVGADQRPKTAVAPPARKGVFAWPLQGEILVTFGRNGNRNCNGVEIAVPEKTPIQAAAAGQVTYSGDDIRGYGNLIIIKHDDSFFTVYGFNRKNLVASGAFVKQGERIALSGTPPTGGRPRLHFEIRQGKTAVDPIFYLP